MTEPPSAAAAAEPTDADLLRAFVVQRTPDPLGRLIARHGPAVYAAARRQLADASLADDVTQAVFLVLIRRAASIRRPELLGGWLMKVTRYCVLNARRAQRRRTDHETRAAMTHSTAAPPAASMTDVLAAVDAAVARLGALDRTIVTLSYLHSRTAEDVGRSLGMKPPAVRQRLSRALARLRDLLADGGLAVTGDALAATLVQSAGPAAPATAFLPTAAALQAGGSPAATAIAGATARQLAVAGLKWVAVVGGVGGVAAALVIGGASGLWHAGPLKPTPPATRRLPNTGETGNVYASDFTAGRGGWTDGAVSLTPKTHTPFLGPFANNAETRLPLADLPPHAFLRIRADLYIMNTWDGVSRVTAGMGAGGPDFWSLRVDGRSTLVRTTFAMMPGTGNFALQGKLQTYPSVVPGYPHPVGTGATAMHSLGYLYTFGGGLNTPFPMDAVYHIDITLPHTAAAAVLAAQGTGLGGVGDESWGLTNVKIDTLAADAVAAPSADELRAAWDAVAGSDAVAAKDAFWKLVGGADATVAFLRSIEVAPGFNEADVRSRAAALTAGDAKAAFDARRDLVAMGPGVEPLLLADARFEGAGDPAVRQVLEQIELRPIDTPAARAAAAKARLLGVIDSPAAKDALGAWLRAAPAWTPDPLSRFEKQYYLPGNVALAYIAKPDAAARADFMRRRDRVAEPISTDEASYFDVRRDLTNIPVCFDLADPSPNVFTPLMPLPARDEASMRGAAGAGPGKSRINYLLDALAIMRLGKPAWAHVVLPPELRNLSLPGDWMVQFNATPAKRVAALADILSVQSGHRVTATPGKADEVRTTFAGTLKLTPAAQPSAAAATGPTASPSLRDLAAEFGLAPPRRTNRPDVPGPTIHLYVDEKDLALPAAELQPLSDLQMIDYFMFSRFYRHVSLPNLSPQQMALPDGVRLAWHPGALPPVDRDDAALPENRRRVDQVLANLAAQLGMTAKHAATTKDVVVLSVAP